MKSNKNTFKLVFSGLMLCLGILLPFVTSHAFGISGNIFLPMHIPVFLCGYLCGPLMGGLCGLILPILNSGLTGMPVFFPMAIIMTGELFAYGLFSGLFFKILKHKNKGFDIYLSLILAMVCGRIISGLTAWALMFISEKLISFSVIASLINGIPGIIIQLAIIPLLVSYLQKINIKKQ